MNHHTAALFNGALSASQALMGLCLLAMLDQYYLCKMNHHTAVLFNGALPACQACLMGLCLLNMLDQYYLCKNESSHSCV